MPRHAMCVHGTRIAKPEETLSALGAGLALADRVERGNTEAPVTAGALGPRVAQPDDEIRAHAMPKPSNPKGPRVPRHAIADIVNQEKTILANHCRNPACPNYGTRPRAMPGRTGPSAGRDPNHRLHSTNRGLVPALLFGLGRPPPASNRSPGAHRARRGRASPDCVYNQDLLPSPAKPSPMAILDPRLLPFIEVLAELGLDWLAFELVEGVQRGAEHVEDESALRLARDRARRATDAREHVGRFGPPGSMAPPLLGDDQLEWATRYVDDRLSAALDQMAHSLDALDEIVAGADARPSAGPVPTTRLVLRGDDSVDAAGRGEVDGARARLGALREALVAWLLHERSDPRQ